MQSRYRYDFFQRKPPIAEEAEKVDENIECLFLTFMYVLCSSARYRYFFQELVKLDPLAQEAEQVMFEAPRKIENRDFSKAVFKFD